MDRAVKMVHAGANIERSFTCEEYALLDGVVPDGWTVVSNTCAIYLKDFHSPYASFTPDFGASGIITETPRRYIWDGTVSSNRAIIPTDEVVLPSRELNVEVYVNRQAYYPSEPGETRDFYVNTVDNSIDFVTGAGRPNLNGLKIKVFVWK